MPRRIFSDLSLKDLFHSMVVQHSVPIDQRTNAVPHARAVLDRLASLCVEM